MNNSVNIEQQSNFNIINNPTHGQHQVTASSQEVLSHKQSVPSEVSLGTDRQAEIGQQMVKQWMELPTDQLINKLITSFPDSSQTLKQMNSAQIRQIVQQIYAEISTKDQTEIHNASQQSNKQKEDTAQAKPTFHIQQSQQKVDNSKVDQPIGEAKQPITLQQSPIQVNSKGSNQQESHKALQSLTLKEMKSKLIDLLPDIFEEVQQMQQQTLLELYKAVMDQYGKAINHQEAALTKQPQSQTNPTEVASISVQQANQIQLQSTLNGSITQHQQSSSGLNEVIIIEDPFVKPSVQKPIQQGLLPLQDQKKKNVIPQKQIINLDCEVAQPSSQILNAKTLQENLKRSYQQMNQSNPSAKFSPEQLRNQLKTKLPHLTQHISSFTTQQLQEIYQESLLAQAKQQKKDTFKPSLAQRSQISFHKSQNKETELFELKEGEKHKTLVLLHTLYNQPQKNMNENQNQKQSSEEQFLRHSDGTLKKIFKVLSQQ